MQTIRIDLEQGATQITRNIAAVLKRQIESRSKVEVTDAGVGDVRIELRIAAVIGSEGYTIAGGENGSIRIIGNDERGLLYGVGKFLRTSRYRQDTFEPGTWRGSSAPQKPMRGIYFATHFHNFYHDAPVEEVECYVEDLALWGYNILNVWFDMHHFNGIDDPQAQAMVARLHAILRAANNVGIGASLAFLANEAYANSPKPLRADWTAGHDGYHHEPGGHYHVELCPNKQGAQELLLHWVDEKLAAFGDLNLDALWIWPYDQGGCTCARCAPWGVNGFFKMAAPIAQRYRQAFPRGKVILSTWYFDHFIDGEWAGLERAFGGRTGWVDYLMVDDYGDRFPEYPLLHGTPGHLPMVNFPEISMYRCDPWGGYGANPMPLHVQSLWDTAGQKLSGGFPYSEGIYEDINKAICAQFYWQEDKPALDTVREYIAFEYSPQVVAPVLEAIQVLEHNLPHARRQVDGDMRMVMDHSDGAVEAYELLRKADGMLTPQARAAWRWRILYLRGLIDAELAQNDFMATEQSDKAFDELTRIYYAERTSDWVAPPTKKSRGAHAV
jgi:hypothetical protein